MTTITASSEVAPPKPKRGVRMVLRLLALLFGAVICAAAGFGAGWFTFSNSNSPMSEALRLIDRGEGLANPTDSTDPKQKVPRPKPDGTAFATSYYTFDEPVTTNPAGSRRFVQLSISLSTQYDAAVFEHVDTHKIPIRSDMLTVISSFSEEALTTPEGREALAEDLRAALNARLETLEGFGGIEGVYFPSFVIQ